MPATKLRRKPRIRRIKFRGFNGKNLVAEFVPHSGFDFDSIDIAADGKHLCSISVGNTGMYIWVKTEFCPERLVIPWKKGKEVHEE